MSADAIISTGRNAILSYVSYKCLCTGAGTNNDMGRKVAYVFGLSTAAEGIFSILGLPGAATGPLNKGVTTAAYGYTALLLSGSEQLAKLAMLVKLASLTIVQPIASAMIQKASFSKANEPKVQNLARALIHGGTLGVLARAAGYSDKVALAVVALFASSYSIENGISSWYHSREGAIQNVLTLFGATAATNWVTGMALRYILSK